MLTIVDYADGLSHNILQTLNLNEDGSVINLNTVFLEFLNTPFRQVKNKNQHYQNLHFKMILDPDVHTV